MASFKSAFKLEALGRYREPAILFGGGLLAGLLIFLVWLAFSTSSSVDTATTEPEAEAVTQKLQAGGAGVLGGISGGSSSGKVRSVSQAPADAAASDATAADQQARATSDSGGTAPVANAASAASEGEALTSGLFGPDEAPTAEPAPEAAPEAPVSEPAKDQ